MKHTEEDIKANLIIPWLKSLGFSIDELRFEKSFKLNLGKHVYQVDTAKQIANALPRLDILVTRNGLNLFVVEVKRDGSKLTDDDRDQAISYARLVHPMAPVAIVTDGKEFRIYKVGDKNELKKDKTAILGYKIDPVIDSIYEEAFEFFIGYSPENVRIFCNAQVTEGMKTLRGSHERKDKKFIPDLYVRSKKSSRSFQEFLHSDKPVFALIGDSGSGKTCSMCGITLDMLKEQPVLFYRAINLIEGITKTIANDFNWGFSASSDDISLFKRLNNLFSDKKLIIILDAVDEWEHPSKVEILGDFASKIKNRNFKLVISCKSGQWNRFLQSAGIPTALSEEIYSAQINVNGYFIEPFDTEELHGHDGLIKKYRHFYNYDGPFESEVYEECKRSPFLMRVLFETAANNKYPYLSFTIKDCFDRYYQGVIDKISKNRSDAEYAIKEIARLLYEKNVDALDLEIISKESLANTRDSVMDLLFEENILEKVTEGINTKIRFYFQKLRDYIIAFGVRKWDKISVQALHEDWSLLPLVDVRLDAVRFYYPFADNDKKKIIDGIVRNNAESYLNFYIQILNESFVNLKNRFCPYEDGAIGFIGILDIARKEISAHGFKIIKENEDRVVLIPDDGSFWRNASRADNRMYLMGASNIHSRGSDNGFVALNIKKEVLEGEIVSQLTNIVDNGLLNESQNYYLGLEKILGIIVSRQQNIHGISNKNRLSQHLPIMFEKIEYGFRYKKAYDHYNQELVDEKIRQGVIKVAWNGTSSSYRVSMSNEDRKTIHQQAHDAALLNINFGTNNIEFKKVEQASKEALACIKQKKDKIDETILPDVDKMTGRGYYFDFFQTGTLIAFLAKFYSIFFQEYKMLIETNFPSFSKCFTLYSQMPVHYFLHLDNRGDDVTYRIYKCANTVSADNEVTICDQNETPLFDMNKFILSYRNKQNKVYSVQNGRVQGLYPSRNYLPFAHPSEFAILRAAIYGEIKHDLPNITKQIFAMYDN